MGPSKTILYHPMLTPTFSYMGSSDTKSGLHVTDLVDRFSTTGDPPFTLGTDGIDLVDRFSATGDPLFTLGTDGAGLFTESPRGLVLIKFEGSACAL
jgi:hypothetical protein